MTTMKGLSILIVDDEDDLREILSEEFSYFGAEVFEASNGNLAFEFLQKNKVDIVFSDVRMPGGDGIELIKNIARKMIEKPKIFLCTGFSDLTEAESKKYGVIEIFSKPFEMDQMVRKIVEAVKK